MKSLLEFSSGVRDITAIRDFLKYANDNWADTLKYVLLFGDGHYDYRNIYLTDYVNYLPPFEIANMGEVNSRETDNFYVAFGMGSNLDNIRPWLAIGRIPVNSMDQIEIVKQKLTEYNRSYLINPDKNGWQTNVTLVSDDEIGSSSSTNELPWHLNPTEEINKRYIPSKFNRTKVYLHEYELVPGGLGRWKPKATEKLLNQINNGTLLVSFFGHGNPDTWAHESVLNRSRDLQNIQNVGRLPLWVAATCTWGKFDDPTHTSMSEELVVMPERGGIGVISAARPVFVTSNVSLTTNFYKNLFNNRSETLPSRLVGDALHGAMESSVNYQKYHLFTDPTMHLADPRYVVKIDSIAPDTLKALSVVYVKAKVTTTDGSLVPDFSGEAVIHAYDAVDSVYTNINNINLHYTHAGGTIFKGSITVQNGIMDGNFIVPKSIKYKNSKTGRLSVYAWDDDGMDAIGYVDSLLFNGTNLSTNDQDGPEMAIAFAEAPAFFDGDFVSSQPTLVVEMTDESGINLTGEVGHKIEATIDNALKKDLTEFFVYDKDNYKSGKLTYTLPVMTNGKHELKITSWDNLNNYSEQTITFRTNASTDLAISEVVNYPNPFGNETNFTFQMIGATQAEVTISIYTVTGRKIQEIKDIAQPGFNKIPSMGTWNGQDWDGDYLANGVYLYKIVVDDGTQKVEKIEKLAIVR